MNSRNDRYEVIKNDNDLLVRFKSEQSWTPKLIPKTATTNAPVTLSINPDMEDSDFTQAKYHKGQANDTAYSHEGGGFSSEKWQVDVVMKCLDSDEVRYLIKNATKEPVKKHDAEDESGNAPKKSFST
ncbi:hypothetical protein LTR36_006228 [Oleoguttula mirabilis]|uniref:Uncharacterized protein n=1 Tax=Oleoguttula mirabilis TaxID=1507867 RepID=A0AAV9JC13_9PEZI|nr:hypothetical protein LTR36_006228 [Oleoguttula mirabilis]